MTLSQDILAELAEIAPVPRSIRRAPSAMPPPVTPREVMKCCSASRTLTFLLMNASRWPRRWQNCTRADALAAHYAGFGLADPTTDRLVPALAFARLLTFTPVEATPGALHTLTSAGWSLRGIVTLAQLVAFVSFQSRLLLGLRALNHKPIVSADTPLVAGYWHTTPYAQSGKAAPVRFTRDELHWEPWLADKPLAEFNAEEQAILAKYGHSDSPLLSPAGAQPAGAGAADPDR